jgi:hypothetical protein
MKHSDSFWEWDPLVSFGIFRFGTPLKNYKRLRPIWLRANYSPPAPECNTDCQQITYTLPKYLKSGFIQIHIDYQGLIHSVDSKKFLYKGYNLINMTIDEIENILGVSFDYCDADEILREVHDCASYCGYYYYKLGLCIWEKNNTIDYIDASSAYED